MTFTTRLPLAAAILCLASTASGHALAQDCPAGQSCFYVAPAMVPPGGSTAPESELWLSVPSGTATGTYSIDGGADTPFTVMSTAAMRVPLVLFAVSSDVNVPATRGVFVVADREDLLVEHKQSLFAGGLPYTEGYSETVPRHTVALGTRFRLGGFRMTGGTPIGYAATSQYAMITAPEDAIVTLTAPPGASLPYWTGSATDTHTVTLAAGESVTVAASQLLDGALAVSTTPISVASGGRGWLSPCGDNGSDVLVPTSQLGTQFGVRLPSGTAGGSNVSVIADVDGTEVSIGGTLVATLDAGETHSFVPTAPSYIETSSPALVWMNGSRGSCELDAALIPPLELVDLPLAITFNASFAGEAAALIPTAEVAGLLLDGAAITATSSTALPGRTDMTIVVFDVAAGLHTVSADHGFQLLVASTGAGAGILAYFGPFVSCTTDTMCEDVGPCTTEACVMSACVATPVAAGMPGGCAAGLVCSGDTGPLVNTCVACASDDDCADPTPVCDPATGSCVEGEPMDAGTPDAGTTARDGGARDGGTRDGGRPPGDGGGARDAGPPVTTEGGCCAVAGAKGERGLLSLVGLVGLGALLARRRSRRPRR